MTSSSTTSVNKMASTPLLNTASPMSLMNLVPKEHEKAIKQAFYNTAANIFVLLAFAAAVAVYFILEAFLKPLLWAVLCGAFLNPFKRSLTNVLRNWLNGLNASGTPFLVGLVVIPIKCADQTADYCYNLITQQVKLVLGLFSAIIAAYVLWHFGPLWSIFAALQSLVLFTYNLLGYFSSFWVSNDGFSMDAPNTFHLVELIGVFWLRRCPSLWP